MEAWGTAGGNGATGNSSQAPQTDSATALLIIPAECHTVQAAQTASGTAHVTVL